MRGKAGLAAHKPNASSAQRAQDARAAMRDYHLGAQDAARDALAEF